MASEGGTIFDFELDFAGTLRCIPMAVRFKLDQCGIKLSLRQWSRFTREDRAELLERVCSSPVTSAAYGEYLARLIETRAKQSAEHLPVDTAPVWNAEQVPDRVASWAESVGVPAPRANQWARLTPLQRFALYKLTRPGHDNDNFVPAMREFGLLS